MSRIHPAVWAIGLSVAVIGGLGAFLYLSGGDDNPNPDDKPLVIFCAAGVQKPMQAIADEYEKEYGQRVEFNFGGSQSMLA